MMQALRSAIVIDTTSHEANRVKPIMVVTASLILAPAIFNDILPYALRNVMLVVGCLITLVFFFMHTEFDLRSIGIGFAWLAFAVIAFLNRCFTGGSLSFAQVALPIAAIATCAISCSKDWMKSAMFSLLALLTVHLVATLLFYVSPDVYTSTVKVWFFADNRNAIGYQSGLTAHYSNNGFLMAMGFLLAFCLSLSNMDGKRKRWGLLCACFLFALVLTQKRSHLFFAVFAVFCVYALSNFKGKTLKISAAVIAGVVVAFILTAYIPEIASSFERLFETFSSGDLAEATTGRTYLWAEAINGWHQSPIVGNGWGSFLYVWPGGNTSIVAHNELLQLLNDMGILGLAFFTVIVSFTLRLAFSNVRNLINGYGNSDSISASAAYFSAMLEVFALSYACTTGSLLQEPINYIPFLFAIALSVTLAAHSNTGQNKAVLDA